MIGTVLKTVDGFRLSVGSNPTPSAGETESTWTSAPTLIFGKVVAVRQNPDDAGVAEWQSQRT